jgi:hypothetical protein
MSAHNLTELQKDGNVSPKVGRPLGHLLGRSPNGGWYQVEPGNWQHYKEPPSEEELNEERAWLRREEERKRKEAEGKAA